MNTWVPPPAPPIAVHTSTGSGLAEPSSAVNGEITSNRTARRPETPSLMATLLVVIPAMPNQLPTLALGNDADGMRIS